ncbi:uncharacterized protein LOC123268886 [Cotesia glomerata]|uniref:acylglycerol lipase n=1 Tax=Cotesia glomerata TaxID=32391 RepID=A0AAV7I8T6_COTGL|nr:uncharacterized protein LOC123268886 [Cotesia glomerata]KAH0546641.1 hypothetical protein KQX54_012820 [Cotesia glomerata]
MSVEVSKASWYSKIYSYLKNRNRIEPAKSKLPDCDFFTVGPRRTLRILKPTQKASESDDLSIYNSESINEKFISKWIERPHSSNSCRCSFYKFYTRNNVNKQSSPKLNQTKTRFKQYDDDEENTSKFKINVSKDLNQFNRTLTSKVNNKIIEEIELRNYFKDRLNIEALSIKNKIIRDLERSIDLILGNVLNHTINVVSTCDKTIDKINYFSDNNESTSSKRDEPIINDAPTNIPLDIKFDFSSDDYSSSRYCVASIDKSDFGGYVNQAFAPCISDPDKLDFYLREPINEKDFDMIDCLDSGINSVETMEVSIESDFNVENSFTQMIEDKFNHMIESSNLNDENTTDSTTQLQTNTDRIDFVQQENKKEIITEKEVTEFTINLIENVEEIVYSDFTSLVAKNMIDKKRLIFDIDSHDKTSLQKIDKIEKFHSTVTLNENVTSKFDDTCKSTDNKETSKLKLKRQLEESENGGTEKNVEEQSSKESLMDSTISKKIRKPIIVFLHGFGSSAEVFENQLQYFSMMGYPCIAPDLLGHGMSSVPDKKRDYHFDKLLNDLEEVLYHYAFKFGQKCVLVAHNYGCSLATALANKYTHEIHRLVLISGGGPIPLVSPTKEGACHCCLRIILSPLLMCGFRRDILYATRGRQHPYCGSEQENQWPLHMKYVLDGMSWPEGDYLFHRRVCVPTLLIHGLKDDKVSLVQECQMERTMPKANLEAISRAGHLPMIDTPNQVNHMIHCFINLLSKKT